MNEPKKTEREARRRIRKADGLSEHFRKNGLLFYPAPDCGSDEAVQEEAGTWRRDNGLPGFRTP